MKFKLEKQSDASVRSEVPAPKNPFLIPFKPQQRLDAPRAGPQRFEDERRQAISINDPTIRTEYLLNIARRQLETSGSDQWRLCVEDAVNGWRHHGDAQVVARQTAAIALRMHLNGFSYQDTRPVFEKAKAAAEMLPPDKRALELSEMAIQMAEMGWPLDDMLETLKEAERAERLRGNECAAGVYRNRQVRRQVLRWLQGNTRPLPNDCQKARQLIRQAVRQKLECRPTNEIADTLHQARELIPRVNDRYLRACQYLRLGEACLKVSESREKVEEALELALLNANQESPCLGAGLYFKAARLEFDSGMAIGRVCQTLDHARERAQWIGNTEERDKMLHKIDAFARIHGLKI